MGFRLARVARRRRRPYESPRPAYATRFRTVPSGSSSHQALSGATGETFYMVRRRSSTPKVGPDAKDARRARTAPGGIGGYRSCGTVPPTAVRVAYFIRRQFAHLCENTLFVAHVSRWIADFSNTIQSQYVKIQTMDDHLTYFI